jgi:hypothetical protein
MSINELIKSIKISKKPIVIYGNGRLGKSFFETLKRNQLNAYMYVVSQNKSKKLDSDGVPIKEFNSIKNIDNYNFVVCIENRKSQMNVMDSILSAGGRSFHLIKNEMVNELYANLYGEINNENDLIALLKEDKNIVVYSVGVFGEIFISRLILKGIRIKFICINSDNTDGINKFGIPIIDFKSIKNELDSKTVVLAIENFWYQKTLITPLRKAGVKKTVLVRESLIEEIYLNYKKNHIEAGGNLRVIENYEYIEDNHLLLISENEGKEFRWRIPFKSDLFYSEEVKELFANVNFSNEFIKQYNYCAFLDGRDNQLKDLTASGFKIDIFMSKFHKDKKIDINQIPKWVTPIQAGAALTDVEISDIKDNIGINISIRNRDYSEGTALYWIWKNTSNQDFVGFFHYRRHMTLDNNNITQIVKHNMTLTLPTLISDTVYNFFIIEKQFVLKYDWQLMLEGIKHYSKEYYQTALDYEKSYFYFSNNIFIMRRVYFDDMCSFIFGVVDEVAEFYSKNNIIREDRYAGFLIENLLSIYVMHNRNKLKLAYTDMNFIDNKE